MPPVDYDVRQYQNYERGRALSSDQRTDPLEAFGPVVGVEPSARMREIAQAADPGIDYRPGSAE